MVYILYTNLKADKKVKAALCDIYGLGKNASSVICDRLGISSYLRIKQLPGWKLTKLTRLVLQDYQTGSPLRSQQRKDKERLVGISCYRAIRYARGLPCRGQRTHGNARTTRRLGGSSPTLAKKRRG